MNLINSVALLISFVYFLQSIFTLIYFFGSRQNFKTMKDIFKINKLIYIYAITLLIFVITFIMRSYVLNIVGIILLIVSYIMYMSLKIYFGNMIKQDGNYIFIGAGIIDISKIDSLCVEKGYNLERKLNTHKNKFSFSFIKSKYFVIKTKKGNVIVNKIYNEEYENVLKDIIKKDCKH